MKTQMIGIKKKLESQPTPIGYDSSNYYSESDDETISSVASNEFECAVIEDSLSLSSEDANIIYDDFVDHEVDFELYGDVDDMDLGFENPGDVSSEVGEGLVSSTSSSSVSKKQKLTTREKKSSNNTIGSSSNSPPNPKLFKKKKKEKKQDPFTAILKFPSRKTQRNKYKSLEALNDFYHSDSITRVDTFARERFILCLALDGMSASQHPVRVLQDDLKITYENWLKSNEYGIWRASNSREVRTRILSQVFVKKSHTEYVI